MTSSAKITMLDCTLRDGGYYNQWDFPREVVNEYLYAMQAAGIDIVELGFRFLKNDGFKGACAYTTDDYLKTLDIPKGLDIAVMLNGGDLLTDLGLEPTLNLLFPNSAKDTPVDIVRFACHFHEFERVLPAVSWLVDRGFRVGFNLMQIAERSEEEVRTIAKQASEWPIDVLYFADSMGSMSPEDAKRITSWMRTEWSGEIGIHTHDNQGLALENSKNAIAAGATWVDATITGMGRGPGNARTEELVIEMSQGDDEAPNLVPLLTLIRTFFGPMKKEFGWGSNPYYFLSGKYGIHPTYIQEMLNDPRYFEEDILAAIERLRLQGGKKFSSDKLEMARHFFNDAAKGNWAPKDMLSGRSVLLLGAGESTTRHKLAIEGFIKEHKPFVMALNTQDVISDSLIDLRVACNPLRLLADCVALSKLSQPLVTPFSALPAHVSAALKGKDVLDYGISIESETFAFEASQCTLPNSLVVGYALAVASGGGAEKIFLAGFDGYAPGDRRNDEMDKLLTLVTEAEGTPELLAITPCIYKAIPEFSVYGY